MFFPKGHLRFVLGAKNRLDESQDALDQAEYAERLRLAAAFQGRVWQARLRRAGMRIFFGCGFPGDPSPAQQRKKDKERKEGRKKEIQWFCLLVSL